MSAPTISTAEWNAIVESGDPTAISEAAAALADAQEADDLEFAFTVCDYLWNPIGNPGTDLMEASGTDPRNDVGSARLQLKGDSVLVESLMNCRNTMVGVTCEVAGLRYAYYVDTHSYEYKDAAWTSTSECRSIYDVLNFMIIFPMWWMPIAAQIFSHAVFIGPIVTVIETMISQCAMRIQSGWGDFINAVTSLNPDFRVWSQAMMASNGNWQQMIKTPVYVVRTNPFLDTSPQVAKTVRMQSCGQAIKDITGPYGVDIDMSLWRPGDDQPDEYANLDQPTYVVRVKDRSQIEGPTKTVLDSAIRTVVDLEGSLLGNALDPLLNPRGDYHPPGVFTAPALGVNYVQPWAILEAPDSGQDGAIIKCTITDHTPKGWRHILGGKSPKWLTDAINATMSWLIDSASILLGFTGIPSNLMDGFLADSFLAFQLLDNYERRASVGPYHPAMEVFTPTEGTYDVESLFSYINALWESRGHTSGTVVFRNGHPLKLGRDVFRGSLMSLVYQRRTKMLTNYVENIMWRITKSVREITVQIGDNKASEPPLAKHQRWITGLQESFNVATLAPRK
ncbi:Gp37-like protein [[Mycobacterium] crassicus]|uniref:Gp28/Gp37-like domain-containing protein n=1 Tax=[Mycobacterium] crassicus TaxID=2872309 RepID=A0ABU5XJ23_9MYCO|nr:hypothetical protein [Mycolicibacter sp. MYC098]MEB3021317.1 hypothetical protein [Mycolicibacter sp. MYC098]